MTKILLETIFTQALLPQAPGLHNTLYAYQQVYRQAYRPAEQLAALLQMAGDCIKQADGHLYFVGAGGPGLIG